MRRLGLVALAAFVCAAAAMAAPQPAPAGRFDYYILALSWSPTYCASIGAVRRDPLQCNARRGFIVHGLWPEYEHGWPSHCASPLARDVPLAVQRQQFDLTPSSSLVVHEWQTHGLCTGLAQSAYFAAERSMRQKLKIPAPLLAPAQGRTFTAAALRAAFKGRNPALPANGLAIICAKGRLEEVRVCFTKAGVFRRCAPEVRDQCGPGALTAPASPNR